MVPISSLLSRLSSSSSMLRSTYSTLILISARRGKYRPIVVSLPLIYMRPVLGAVLQLFPLSTRSWSSFSVLKLVSLGATLQLPVPWGSWHWAPMEVGSLISAKTMGSTCMMMRLSNLTSWLVTIPVYLHSTSWPALTSSLLTMGSSITWRQLWPKTHQKRYR